MPIRVAVCYCDQNMAIAQSGSSSLRGESQNPEWEIAAQKDQARIWMRGTDELMERVQKRATEIRRAKMR